MRLLCDQNVAVKYVLAFNREEGFVVATVADTLCPEVSDDKIVAYAAEHDWVVFTSDSEFFEHAVQCGILVYNQLFDPSRDIVTAVTAIEEVYESNREIVETVPGNWI
jgi:uncharacterized protein YaiI (UPF0178 family)